MHPSCVAKPITWEELGYVVIEGYACPLSSVDTRRKLGLSDIPDDVIQAARKYRETVNEETEGGI